MDDQTKQWLEELGLTSLKEARAIQRDLYRMEGIYVEDFIERLKDVDYSYGGAHTRVACLPKFPDDEWGEGWEREAALKYFAEKYPDTRLGEPFATYRYWCQRVFVK